MAAPSKKNSKHGRDQYRPTQQAAKVPARAAYKPVAGTRYGNLATPLQFMSHFGGDPQQPPPKLPTPIAPQKENIPPPPAPVQSAPESVSAKKLSSTPSVIDSNRPSLTNVTGDPPAKPKGLVGLSGSMWGPSPEPNPQQKEEPKLRPFEHVTQVAQSRYQTALMPHQQTSPGEIPVKTESLISLEQNKKSDEDKSTVSLNSSKKPGEVEDLFESLTKNGLSTSIHATKSASSGPKYPFAVYSSKSSVRSDSETGVNNTDVASLDLGPPTTAEHPPSRGQVSSQARKVVSNLSSASIEEGMIKPRAEVPLAGLKSSDWAPTLDKPLVTVREHPVKVKKNGAGAVDCTLKVTKADGRSPCVLVIEVNETRERILEESVFHDATWTASSSEITFKANHKGDVSPTWVIEFQLPAWARGTYNMIVSDAWRPVFNRKTKSSILETPSTNLNDSSNSIVPSLESASLAPEAALASMKMDIDRQFSELPAEGGESTDLISIASDSGQNEDTNGRINTRLFNLLNSIEGVERLLDIEDEDTEPVEKIEQHVDENFAAPSALMDLAVLNDDYTVQSVFNTIDSYYDTFLNRLFNTVEDTKLPRDAPTLDFMASKPHIMAAEQLVTDFFGRSDVFTKLRQEEVGVYITDMGWKILAKALMGREEESADAIQVAECNRPANSMETANGVSKAAADKAKQDDEDELERHIREMEEAEAEREKKEAKMLAVAGPNPPANNELQNVAHGSALSDTESTRNYSVDELLSMRNLALEVKQELLSKKDMASITTRPAPAPTTRAPASSVGSWQSFANTSNKTESQKPTPTQSVRASSPSVPKVGATDPPPKGSQEQATQERSSQTTKPAATTNSWQAFAKAKSSAEPAKSSQKPVGFDQGEDLALDVQSPPTTPSKARLVEVYKARDLTPTTSTTGWKSWAKTTSGVEPAVRPPTLITPAAVTSSQGWQTFATTESGVEPEKPKPANLVPVVTQSQPSLIQQVEPKPSKESENVFKSKEALEGTAQDKPLPPHLRKLNTTIPSQDAKHGQKATAQTPAQEKTLPPHLRKVEPFATAVKPAPENPEIPDFKAALQDKPVASLNSQVEPSSQDKMILLTSISTVMPDNSLSKIESPFSSADEQRQIEAAPSSSAGAWHVFAGLKPATETKVLEVSVAPKSNTETKSIPKPDSAMYERIVSDLSSLSFKPEPMRKEAESKTMKSVADAPPSRGNSHLATNSECDRLAETFQALKLEKDDEEKPSLDFFTTEPLAVKPKMATPHAQFKSAPGLSASRFAPGGNQASFGTQPPRPHVEDAQDESKPIKFKERTQPPFPTPRPPRSYITPGPPPASNSPVIQFSAPGARHTTYVQNGFQIPSPIVPRQPAPPAMQTVLVPDPNTGILVEVTGYVKATPLPSPQPSPAYSSPISYENAGYQQPSISQAPSFPPRSDMYRHVSNESSGSEKQFSPNAPVFKPSPAREQSQGAAGYRPPLSPVRRGNVQAALQRRLNESLARSPGR